MTFGISLWFLEEKHDYNCTQGIGAGNTVPCINNSWTCVATVCKDFSWLKVDPCVEKKSSLHVMSLTCSLGGESGEEVKNLTDYKGHMNHRGQLCPPGPRSCCGLTAPCASTANTPEQIQACSFRPLSHYFSLLTFPSLHCSVCSAASHYFYSSLPLFSYLSISALVLNH